SGAQKIMAGVDIVSVYRVGKYFIDLDRFESVAIPALDYAEKECDVIGIDEIGRMELFSKAFEQKVNGLLTGRKPLLAVVHRNYIEKYKEKGILYTVDVVNRNQMPGLIFFKMTRLLRIL
ncbi:hypothetical protein KEJ21_00285, partial [Candidatus Bathyarchaeota archaeon]|nr:hypothetical protein [Candidatus Bathyarchaeota archaeon]